MMNNSCDLPPCSPCPPATPPMCPQKCPGPPTSSPCIGKPVMRGLHWKQTQRKLAEGFTLAFIVGGLCWVFIKLRREERYRDFHAKAEVEDWADEMARKGLFQSVPSDSLKDKFKK